MRADRRIKRQAVAAVGFEIAAVAVALTNNLTRWFNDSLTDGSTLLAAAGLVLVGMAAEGIWRVRD